MWPCILHEGVVLGDPQNCECIVSDLFVGKSGMGSMVNAVATNPSGILPPSEHRKPVSALLDISSEAMSPRQVDTLCEVQ